MADHSGIGAALVAQNREGWMSETPHDPQSKPSALYAAILLAVAILIIVFGTRLKDERQHDPEPRFEATATVNR